MNALITGATGFIGNHLTHRLLNDGHRVVVIVRSQSKPLKVDANHNHLTTLVHDGTTRHMVDLIGQVKPDIVFHLASLFRAEHQIAEVESLIQSNVLFGTQVLEGMLHAGVKQIINTGTSWQHFENQPYNPVCLYAATKEAFEVVLQFYVQAHQFKAISLHLADSYGPQDERGKLLGLLVKIAQTGETIDMSMGEQPIDLVHVDDLVNAYCIAGEAVRKTPNASHQIYQLTSGASLSLRKLVAVFEKIVGRPLNINWGRRPYRNREMMTPWTCGQVLPNWQPKVQLVNGLKNLWPR